MTGTRTTVIGLLTLVLSLGTAHSQGKKKKNANIPPEPWTGIHVRDAFIDRIGEDGFYCRLPAPAIVVADTPLFGEYEKNTDNLVSPDWTQLRPEGKAVFLELAGPDATDKQAEKVFDLEAHHWILVLETVRWWEACKELTLKLTPYQAELQAARVTLAYWRERDPEVVQQLVSIAAVLDKDPSPIPAGQDFPTYFNQHYQKTASGREYLWMQAQVIKVAMAEDPEPALVQTMKSLE
jgi:hypothetical protein